MTLAETKTILDKATAKRDYLNQTVHSKEAELLEHQKQHTILLEARSLCNGVLVDTQNSIKTYVENIVSNALQTIFQEDYTFEVEFDVKRNQPEASFYLVHKGLRLPVDGSSSGGGILDVISVILRIVAGQMRGNSNLYILDEPAKYLKNVEQEKALGEVLHRLADDLDLQIIMVTHSPHIADIADKVYRVKKTGQISKAEVV